MLWMKKHGEAHSKKHMLRGFITLALPTIVGAVVMGPTGAVLGFAAGFGYMWWHRRHHHMTVA